jgi:glyoxylase-like metal-dependent hydrolase (beta-lactamase superfamily II)
MKFGQYDCQSLDLGTITVDGGAMFGIIPRVKWETKMPPDEQHRIRLKVRALLIRGNGRVLLVDTGCGTKLAEAMRNEYGIESTDLLSVLDACAIHPGDVTDVVLTHLHFDHAGGATVRSDHRVIPTFPNAVYYIQSEQWEEANNPSLRDRDSFLADDFVELMSSGQLRLLDGSLTLHEGLEIMVTYGHCKAQQHVVVKGETQSLFSAADLVPTAAHIPVPWHMGFDSRPVDLFPEKDYFLRKAIRENWILHLPHDPLIEAISLRQGDPWMILDRAWSL